MHTADLIQRIRTTCPLFAAVDHALSSDSDQPRPLALVTPSSVRADVDGLIDSPRSQMVTQTFSLFVMLARVQDRADGKGTHTDLDNLTDQLRTNIPGWQLDPYHAPMNFAGGALDRYQTGEVCWREDYSVVFELRG